MDIFVKSSSQQLNFASMVGGGKRACGWDTYGIVLTTSGQARIQPTDRYLPVDHQPKSSVRRSSCGIFTLDIVRLEYTRAMSGRVGWKQQVSLCKTIWSLRRYLVGDVFFFLSLVCSGNGYDGIGNSIRVKLEDITRQFYDTERVLLWILSLSWLCM